MIDVKPTATTTTTHRPRLHVPRRDRQVETAPVPVPTEQAETREHKALRYTGAVARISLGSIFLWAFVDKLFGFDHATPSAKSWLNGGSPTTGFLKGVSGPFADQFHSIAGSAWADWLFMIGLAGIGLALIFGVGMRVAAASAGVLLVLMWAASLPIKTNPFLDDHLIYAVVIVVLALAHAGDTFGLGKYWSKLSVVKKFPVLR